MPATLGLKSKLRTCIVTTALISLATGQCTTMDKSASPEPYARFVSLNNDSVLHGDIDITAVIPDISQSGTVFFQVDDGSKCRQEGHPVIPLSNDPNAPLHQELSFSFLTQCFSNGRHDLLLLDEYGHRIDHRSVLVANELQNIRLTGLPYGNKPIFNITGTLTMPQPWCVQIKGIRNDVVRTYEGNGEMIDVAWDGSNKSQEATPSGAYYAVVKALKSGETAGGIMSGTLINLIQAVPIRNKKFP